MEARVRGGGMKDVGLGYTVKTTCSLHLLLSLHIAKYRIMSIAVGFNGYNYAATLDCIGKKF
jgi:hypothetical protein